jgi:quinol monooxygenase YgiN
MLFIIAQIHVLSEKISEANIDLNKLVTSTQLEEGCLRYDLYQITESGDKFFLLEEWRDEKYLEKHLESQHIKEFNSSKKTWISGKIEINRVEKVSDKNEE